MKPPVVLSTEREGVELRQLSSPDDDLAYYESYNASRAEIMAFDPDAADLYETLDQVRAARLDPSNPDKLRFGIWDKDTFVGSINLTPDEIGAEIGYWRDSRHGGMGYTTIAARALAHYAADRYPVVHANVIEGNDASARVLRRVGFILVGQIADTQKFILPPVLLPSHAGKEQDVQPGEYRVIGGTADPIDLVHGKLIITPKNAHEVDDPLPGVHHRGWFTDHSNNTRQVVSFLYHKLDNEGNLETTERTIVLNGIGYGEHPGHAGQAPSWYLIGPQVGTIDHASGRTVERVEPSTSISAKHFSIACINGGPLGEPILANAT